MDVTISRGDRPLALTEPRGDARVAAGPPAASAAVRRLRLSHGRVALRTADGAYLTVLPDDGLGYALYPCPELTPAATFEEVLWPGGEVSLRTHLLTFLSVQDDGVVTAHRSVAGASERLRLDPVPDQTRPAVPRVAAIPTQPGPRPAAVPAATPPGPLTVAERRFLSEAAVPQPRRGAPAPAAGTRD